MRDRLTADDSDERRAAAAEVHRLAVDDPASASGYAPLLVAQTADDAGYYAMATLCLLRSAGVLEAEPHLATLQAGVRNGVSVGDETRRAAELLAWISKEQATAVAGGADTLLAALEHEETRGGAMEALYHLSNDLSVSLDVAASTVKTYVDDVSPRVRGDAIGLLGQLGTITGDTDRCSLLTTLLAALDDPDVTVRQSALGVLVREAAHWPNELSPQQLCETTERIMALRDTTTDATVRSRTERLFEELASAVLVATIRHTVGVDCIPTQTVEDALVDAAAADLDVAYEVTATIPYQARSDTTKARGEEVLDRIARRYPDQLESGGDLREAGAGFGERVIQRNPALVADLTAALRRATA